MKFRTWGLGFQKSTGLPEIGMSSFRGLWVFSESDAEDESNKQRLAMKCEECDRSDHGKSIVLNPIT
jgi:hypothetical protein